MTPKSLPKPSQMLPRCLLLLQSPVYSTLTLMAARRHKRSNANRRLLVARRETLASQDTCLNLTAKRLPRKLVKDAARGGGASNYRFCAHLRVWLSGRRSLAYAGEATACDHPTVRIQSEYNQITFRVHSEYIQSMGFTGLCVFLDSKNLLFIN